MLEIETLFKIIISRAFECLCIYKEFTECDYHDTIMIFKRMKQIFLKLYL